MPRAAAMDFSAGTHHVAAGAGRGPAQASLGGTDRMTPTETSPHKAGTMNPRHPDTPTGSAADGAEAALSEMNPGVQTALVENHRDFLRFLSRRVGDADTAADLLQQFYVRAMTRASDLRQSDSVIAWLYRLLRTTLIDHYRREAARRRGEAAYAQLELLAGEEPDAELERAVCACVETLLPALKTEYAEILKRVDLLGTPPREVARDLGLAPNNVRVRLHRARQALKQSLLLSCRTCAEHGCLDCDCGQSKRAHGRGAETRPGTF